MGLLQRTAANLIFSSTRSVALEMSVRHKKGGGPDSCLQVTVPILCTGAFYAKHLMNFISKNQED